MTTPSSLAAELSVPEKKLDRLSQVAHSRAALQAWVDNLPIMNTAETGKKLYQTLGELAMLNIDEDDRYELVEILEPAVTNLIRALSRNLQNQPVRLPHPARRAAVLSTALHAQLAAVDAATAARLSPNDAQRIGRALEVWRASGRPLSSFHTRTRIAPTPTEPQPLHIDGQPGLLLALEPLERAWLHQRIGQRFAAMLEHGLIDEVRALRQRPDLHPGLPALRSVGYRQVWQALDALEASGRSQFTAAELATLAEQGAAATRQLAKRQLTWLRSLPQRRVLACESTGLLEAACAALQGS